MPLKALSLPLHGAIVMYWTPGQGGRPGGAVQAQSPDAPRRGGRCES
jgi:hypothetical protein